MFSFLRGSKPEEDAHDKKYSQGVSSMVDAIGDVRRTIETLEKRETHVGEKMNQLAIQAKAEMAKKNKAGALRLMKRRALYEKQIKSIGDQIFGLHSNIVDLEGMSTLQLIHKTRETVAAQIKELQKQMPIERVEELNETFAELRDRNDELTALFAEPVDELNAEYSDEQAEAELEALMMADVDDVEVKIDPNSDAALLAQLDALPGIDGGLPAPAPALSAAEDAELAAEMAKLEASMA